MKKIVIDENLSEDRLEEARKVLGKKVSPGQEVWVDEDKAEAVKEAIGEDSILEDLSE